MELESAFNPIDTSHFLCEVRLVAPALARYCDLRHSNYRFVLECDRLRHLHFALGLHGLISEGRAFAESSSCHHEAGFPHPKKGSNQAQNLLFLETDGNPSLSTLTIQTPSISCPRSRHQWRNFGPNKQIRRTCGCPVKCGNLPRTIIYLLITSRSRRRLRVQTLWLDDLHPLPGVRIPASQRAFRLRKENL